MHVLHVLHAQLGLGVLSQTYQYWNSVLQSAESDSAGDFRAAASIGKQGFGDV